MLKIKHQVFISSTFTDLKEERKEILNAIVSLDCIPSGMEFFPAASIEQFGFIKRIIDDSDYYVLIIGGRYGSISSDGISFTEKEYDYAVEKNIPILCFLRESIDDLPLSKVDREIEKSEKLERFREKVSKNRLVKLWNHPKELAGQVISALANEKKQNPTQGWVKGFDISRIEELEKENNKLLREIMILKDSLSELEKLKVQKYYLSSGYHYTEILDILERQKIIVPMGTLNVKENIEFSLLDIFISLAEKLLLGVWNRTDTPKDELYIFFKVCPSLSYLNLVNKLHPNAGIAQKFELSEDGKKFISLYNLNYTGKENNYGYRKNASCC